MPETNAERKHYPQPQAATAFGLFTVNVAAGPAPSGSTVYDVTAPAVFDGPIIVNGGIDPATAQDIVRNGTVDAVSFGRLWIANPDLPARIRAGGPYTKAITRRFYGGGPDGYNDYPTLETQLQSS